MVFLNSKSILWSFLEENKSNTYFIIFYEQSIPKVYFLFFLSFKNDVYIFLINAYILYTYIHFNVVPNPELVVMLVSVENLRVHLGANIVLYETDSESIHIPVFK